MLMSFFPPSSTTTTVVVVVVVIVVIVVVIIIIVVVVVVVVVVVAVILVVVVVVVVIVVVIALCVSDNVSRMYRRRVVDAARLEKEHPWRGGDEGKRGRRRAAWEGRERNDLLGPRGCALVAR